MAVPALLPLLALVLPGHFLWAALENACMGGAGLGGHPSSPSTSAAGGTAGGWRAVVGPVQGRRGALPCPQRLERWDPEVAHIPRLCLSAALAPDAQTSPVGSAHPSSHHCSGRNLYLGHTLALVTHVKEEREQALPHVLPHLSLVSPRHLLHHLPEEADGELSQLAGLLLGRRTGGL